MVGEREPYSSNLGPRKEIKNKKKKKILFAKSLKPSVSKGGRQRKQLTAAPVEQGRKVLGVS